MATDTGSPAWPPIAFEPRPWHRTGDEVASRRALRAAQGDYRAAVPPAIAHANVALTPDTLALADDASRALIRFDAEAGMLTAPFAAILLRTESASSSEIEHLTAGAKQVALAELGASGSDNARLIVANTRAMQAALDLSDRIDAEAIIAMHEALLRESAPHFVGGWRDQQVWIGGGGISPHRAVFVPPHQDRVPALIADLIEFMRRTDVPVLVQAAIAHAQFETVHPFPDGNGRTGRALLHAMLHHGGLTTNVIVPVSAGLLSYPERYFRALDKYRAGRPDAIVESVSEAAFAAVQNGTALARDIRTVRARWDEAVTARADAAVHRLKDELLEQPIVSAASAAAALGVSAVAAQNAIDRLVNAGVLTKAAGGARNRLWQAPEILAALDDFAARARRGRV